LLERYLDQKVEIVANDGTAFSGQLLSGRNGEVILRADDGQVTVISQTNIRDVRFPALPDGLITRPTLRWLLQTATAGKQQVELTYLTGGMTWTADYTILLDKANTKLDLNGWSRCRIPAARVQDAQVKLVAGDVNRIVETQLEEKSTMTLPTGTPQNGAANVEQRQFFEYQLYEIQRHVTVADNETKTG